MRKVDDRQIDKQRGRARERVEIKGKEKKNIKNTIINNAET